MDGDFRDNQLGWGVFSGRRSVREQWRGKRLMYKQNKNVRLDPGDTVRLHLYYNIHSAFHTHYLVSQLSDGYVL